MDEAEAHKDGDPASVLFLVLDPLKFLQFYSICPCMVLNELLIDSYGSFKDISVLPKKVDPYPLNHLR